jgi:hypothetical protein
MLSSSRGRARRDPSYGITTAENSHLDDITRRQRQYAFTMLFRVVAILVVVLVPGLTVLERVVLGIVATVIPYFAVIRANGGPANAEDPTNLMIGGPRQGALPGPDRGLEGHTRYTDAEDFEGFETFEADDVYDPREAEDAEESDEAAEPGPEQDGRTPGVSGF